MRCVHAVAQRSPVFAARALPVVFEMWGRLERGVQRSLLGLARYGTMPPGAVQIWLGMVDRRQKRILAGHWAHAARANHSCFPALYAHLLDALPDDPALWHLVYALARVLLRRFPLDALRHLEPLLARSPSDTGQRTVDYLKASPLFGGTLSVRVSLRKQPPTEDRAVLSQYVRAKRALFEGRYADALPLLADVMDQARSRCVPPAPKR